MKLILSIKNFLATSLLFIIAVIFRAIPEAVTFLPLGQDTTMYLAYGKLTVRLWNYGHFCLYPVLYNMLGLLYLLNVDLGLVMKILPPIFYGLIVSIFFHYCRSCINLNYVTSVLSALLLLFSPTFLRISWELHNQQLGLFLFFLSMISFVKYKTTGKNSWKLAQLVSSIMLALSHQFVAVLYISCLLYLLIYFKVVYAYFDKLVFINLITAGLTLIVGYYARPQIFVPPVTSIIKEDLSKLRNLTWLVNLTWVAFNLLIPLGVAGWFIHADNINKHFINPILFFSSGGIILWVLTGYFLALPPERYVWILIFPLCILTGAFVDKLFMIKNDSLSVTININRKIAMKKQLNIKISSRVVARFIKCFVLLIIVCSSLLQSLSLMGLASKPHFLPSNFPYSFPNTILYNGIFVSEHECFSIIIENINKISSKSDVLIVHYPIYGLAYYYSKVQVIRFSHREPVANVIFFKNGSMTYLRVSNLNQAIFDLKRHGFENFFLIDRYDQLLRMISKGFNFTRISKCGELSLIKIVFE